MSVVDATPLISDKTGAAAPKPSRDQVAVVCLRCWCEDWRWDLSLIFVLPAAVTWAVLGGRRREQGGFIGSLGFHQRCERADGARRRRRSCWLVV
jgi:hypothetical protein